MTDVSEKELSKFIFNGLLITPKVLHFRDAYNGKSFKEKITLQNVSNKPLYVTTIFPTSYLFKVDKQLHNVKLSSGLKEVIWVNYTYKSAAPMITARLIIYVNDQKTETNFAVTVSEGIIICEPTKLDFQIINEGYAVHVQNITLTNKGRKQTKFEIDIPPNNLGLVAKPKKGFIAAHTSTDIQIELIGFEEGLFVKDIWIKCNNPIRFTIVVEVIKPKLIISTLCDYIENFLPIMFPPIYGGCRTVQTFEIFNYNMLESTYIIVPELNFKVMTTYKIEQINPDFKNIVLNPLEDSISPHEKRKLKISFEPKISNCLHDKVYFICFRLIRLECQTADTILGEQKVKRRQSSNKCVEEYLNGSINQGIDEVNSLVSLGQGKSFEDFIRLCIYGIVKSVQVEAKPVSFTIKEMLVNTQTERFLTLSNKSKILSIHFKYLKVGYINIYPSEGYINSLESVKLKVVFAPTAAGAMDKPIRFQLLHRSQIQDEGKPQLTEVGSIDVPVYIPVKLQSKYVKPKFNLGITPKVGNEVGFLTNDIQFNSIIKKPRQAILQCYKTKPEILFDDSKIAFPNDRPRALRPIRDLKCKTIFAEIPRLISLKDEYTLTDSELFRKQHNESYYLKYIRRNQKKHVLPKPIEDYISVENKLLEKVKKLECMQYITSIQSKSLEKFPRLKPRHIFFVRINPPKIDIGKVIINTTVSYKLSVTNENQFPVHVLMESYSGHKNILPNLPDTHTVKENSKIKIVKHFCPDSLGMFNSIISIYLNNHHLVPILLQAEVVLPVVSLDREYIYFDDQNPSFTRIIPLRNNLNESIRFSWNVDSNSCFTINPLTGIIPSKRSINCEICYMPDFNKRSNTQIPVTCENGSTVFININACITQNKVDILETNIELSFIPLNIQRIVKNILRNSGNEIVLFKIRNPNPYNGIEIEPKFGVINAKTDVELNMKILLTEFINFNCKIEIELQYGRVLKFNVTGTVDFPTIILKQVEQDQIKRIPAGAMDIAKFLVKNKSKTEVKLSFLKDLYPELTISTSNNINISLDSNEEVFLEKDETMELFIHFYPLDICMNQIYLPIVLNDILGPPVRGSNKSLNPNTYLLKPDSATAGLTNGIKAKQIVYKEKLPTLLLSLITSHHILRFSKTSFHFRYICDNETASVTSTEIKVKNCLHTNIEFYIGVNNTYPEFSIVCKQEESITFQDDKIMVFILNGEEEITLMINYIPTSYGVYSCQCPIIIKELLPGRVFNYIKLTAKHHAPHFQCPRWIFLEPVFINTVITYDVYLSLLYHSSNCELKIECELDQLSFQLTRDPNEIFNPNCRKMILKIFFQSYSSLITITKIVLSCTCNAELFIIVGVCAAEDIVTTYSRYGPHTTGNSSNILQSRGFPYFPAEDDMSDFAVYMRKCVNVTERWLFEQMFKMSFYYYIPESMSGCYRYPKKVTNNNDNTQTLVLVQLLKTLIQDDIFSCSVFSDANVTNEIERVHQVHSILKHILIFLNSQGIYLPYVRSRYLLSFNDYIIYMTKVRPMKDKDVEKIKSKENFLRRAKLCWLDFILKIFKNFILSRVTMKKRRSIRASSIRFSLCSNLYNSYETKSPELQLINWLNFKFGLEKSKLLLLVPKKCRTVDLSGKYVRNLTSDLSDGLAFIAVTIHFCPYLKEMFYDIYVDVDTKEKAFHNAVLLIEAWKIIKCSFKINPLEIVEPIPLQMVFLVTYIHEVFSSLQPKDEICFSVGLSSSEMKEITIENPNMNDDLCLEICFLNNKAQCFKTSIKSNVMTIPAGKSAKLQIQFIAKKRQVQKCILLLCGDTEGQNYCKSIVYSLTGESNLLGEHIQLYLEIDLYKSKYLEIPVQSPYPSQVSYDMWYAKGAPTDVKLDEFVTVSEYLSTIRPRTVYFQQTKFQTDVSGQGVLQVYLYCFSTALLEFVLIMSNEDVGDFFISVTIQPVNFDTIEKYYIEIELPPNWNEMECICYGHGMDSYINPKQCPRTILINIPSQNNQFWNIIIESIMQCVSDSDESVWAKYLKSEMGPHILMWLLFGYHELSAVQHALNYNKIYNVFNINAKGVSLPSTVVIPNICSSDYVEIPIHMSEYVYQLDFSLQSDDEDEVRWYQIQFCKKRNLLQSDSEFKTNETESEISNV